MLRNVTDLNVKMNSRESVLTSGGGLVNIHRGICKLPTFSRHLQLSVLDISR